MSEPITIGNATLYLGDSKAVLPTLPDCSVDSILTDPPYELGFMGKKWDASGIAYDVSLWRQCLRVLKPGGHLLAFGGSRTYHRLACAVEDAGFEIVDQIQWVYSSGFPKSHNLDRYRGTKICGCSNGDDALPSRHVTSSQFDLQPQVVRDLLNLVDAQGPLSGGQEYDLLKGVQQPKACPEPDREGAETAGRAGIDEDRLCGLRLGSGQATMPPAACEDSGVQQAVQRQAPRRGVEKARPQRSISVDGREPGELSNEDEWSEQPGMERRGNTPDAARELRAGEIRASAGLGAADGSQGRLCNGTPPGDGGTDWSDASTAGNGSPPRPQAVEQPSLEFGSLAGQQEPQAGGAWPICGGCGKPRVLAGLGTALKPAHEPIVVARKPLIGTVAENVQRHGTGALNIDGCRVPIAAGDDIFAKNPHTHGGFGHANAAVYGDGKGSDYRPASGRWPANLIHDGSEEVLAAFPEAPGQQAAVTGNEPTASGFSGAVKFGGMIGRVESRPPRQETDRSAARFFYCAKASRKDRNEGLTDPGPQFTRGTTLRKVERTETSGNTHPTVKPTALMRYLCRLVTTPGGTILDPFTGSGSTGKAALLEGFRFVGIEREPDYFEIAKARIGHAAGTGAVEAKSVVEPAKREEVQQDLFSFTVA